MVLEAAVMVVTPVLRLLSVLVAPVARVVVAAEDPTPLLEEAQLVLEEEVVEPQLWEAD
jgi:hypothetical protein